MPYAWGRHNGIADALGLDPSHGPEAELWFGAHPASPSKVEDSSTEWPDLLAWEQRSGHELPYLLKLLSAGSPLSLQAHPTTAQAREGYAREEAQGLPRSDFARNYKDPYAKPELIVALEDGFDALCGFRSINETLAEIEALSDLAPSPGWDTWATALTGPDGVRAAFTWLLSGAGAVDRLVTALTEAAQAEPARFGVAALLTLEYPGDPGAAVACMLNHVRLRAGEALWLPAGNIHAYLSGLGVELMGPSDNVLRGGLTRKHVDREELQRVLDFTAGPPSRLTPIAVGPHAVSYRPATVPSGAAVPFELVMITEDTSVKVGSAAIGLILEGNFTIIDDSGARHDIGMGEAFFCDRPGAVEIEGTGRGVLAHAVPTSSVSGSVSPAP